MAAVGLYRCPGNPPWACVLEGAKGSYVAEHHYREGGYQPNFDTLPWESDYKDAKEKARAAARSYPFPTVVEPSSIVKTGK